MIIGLKEYQLFFICLIPICLVCGHYKWYTTSHVSLMFAVSWNAEITQHNVHACAAAGVLPWSSVRYQSSPYESNADMERPSHSTIFHIISYYWALIISTLDPNKQMSWHISVFRFAYFALFGSISGFSVNSWHELIINNISRLFICMFF